MKISLFLFFSVFLVARVFSQSGTLTVIDAKTSEPIPYANICFEGLLKKTQKFAMTDVSGKVTNPISEKSVVVISFVGYQTILDTLITNQSKKYQLKPNIFDVDEVIVTAQYTPKKIDNSIYKVKVIGTKQIDEKGANNLGDLLSNELNIRLSQDASLGSSMKLQGLSGQNVKILIDGVPIVGRMMDNIDLSQVNLSNVDHIEIVEGPMSVMFGSNAMAGAINIITKEHNRNNISTQINGYYETVGVYNFDASFAVKKNRHNFSFVGGRNLSQGYSELGTRLKQWKPKEQINFSGDYVYKTEKSKLKFTSSLFFETLLNEGDPYFQPYAITAVDNIFYTTRFNNSGEYTHWFGNDNQFQILSSYSMYKRVKTTYLKDLVTLDKTKWIGPDNADTSSIDAVLVRGFYSKDSKTNKLNYLAGFDINLETGNGKRIKTDDPTTGDYAAFLSLKYDVFQCLSIQPGLRIIYNTKYDAPLVPSVNIKFQSIGYNVRASYTRGFRAPTMKELYLDFLDVNHNVMGNSNLRAEYGHSFNLNFSKNFEYNRHVTEFEATMFYNNVNDLISLILVDPKVTPVLYSYVNVDQYNTIGTEASLQYRFYPQLSVKVGMSHTGRAKMLYKDNSTYMSEYQFSTDWSLNANYKFVKPGIQLSLSYKYNDTYTELQQVDNDVLEQIVDAYHNLDASMSKSFWRNRISATLGAKNLFDNKSVYATGGGGGAHSGGGNNSSIVGWGRTYFLRLSIKLDKN